MAWSVSTLSHKLFAGTCLCLAETPQLSGGSYPKAGARFVIRRGTGRIDATVVSSTPVEMVITTDVGRWFLTPWKRGDDPIRANAAGLQPEYWVVRSRA
jgi:hypothetical protein